MSILTDMRAAYDELDAARAEFDRPLPVLEIDFIKREDRLLCAIGNVQKIASIDTIRALLDVAEAAREVGIYIDEDYFNAAEERVFGRLAASLAPLVKEADDE